MATKIKGFTVSMHKLDGALSGHEILQVHRCFHQLKLNSNLMKDWSYHISLHILKGVKK